MGETAKGASQSARTSQKRRQKSRRLLVQALYQWLLAETEKDQLIAQYREDNPGKVDWEFFESAIDVLLKSLADYEQLLVPKLDREFKSLDPVEKAILYLGTYELQQRIDVPYRVVINEYVELAKLFGATDGHKYINGVLDRLATELRAVEVAAKN